MMQSTPRAYVRSTAAVPARPSGDSKWTAGSPETAGTLCLAGRAGAGVPCTLEGSQMFLPPAHPHPPVSGEGRFVRWAGKTVEQGSRWDR